MVDVRVGARRPTYPDGDAVLIVAGRELDDKLGAGLLLGVVERPEPADHLDAVLGGDLSLPRRLHCHCESGGDGDYGGDDDEGACVCARARLCACVRVYLALDQVVSARPILLTFSSSSSTTATSSSS